MENANFIDKSNRILICVFAYVLLAGQSFSVVCAEHSQLPDEFKVSEYFSFFGSGGIDWRVLNDPNNNPILVACIKGCTDESLKPLGIPNIQQRLESLERGNLIKKVDGRYILTFPAIIGDKRQALREYAEQAAGQLFPLAEKMITQIRSHLSGHDDMLYHVLWSVVMDGGPAWDAAREQMNRKITAGDTSIQNKAWLLYPSHPFRVGTNSWNNSLGHLRVTWNRNTPSPNAIGGIISQYANQLSQAIEQDHTVESTDVKDALGKYGLINEAGKVRFYIIHSDSDAAAVYVKLGMEFGRQMMAHLDVNKIAGMLEVSPGIAFVIAYHEICWQLLQDLAEKKVLTVPRIVANAGTQTSEAYQLVSLAMGPRAEPLSPETDISKKETQAIEYFEKTKNEILQGSKFSNQSTPVNALLALISAYYHQDQQTLERIFPIVRQKQYEKLSSPEVREQMLTAARDSILCKIEIEDKLPEESDLCALYTRESPEKPMDQVWSFAYVEGAWRFAGSTSALYNWRTQAIKAEAITRNILRTEADKAKTAATSSLKQKEKTVVGKWQAILTEFNQMYVMRFWRKPDGTLAGAATRNKPDDRPFLGVTFENGKLRFEEKTNQGIFEGTMKEDGLTIEGKWQKPDMLTPCVLKRLDDVEIEDKLKDGSEKVQGTQEPDKSTSNRVLSLDGKEDYIRIADSQSLHSFSDAITIEAWVKASSYAENGNINSIIRKNIAAGAENFLLRFRNVDSSLCIQMSLSQIGILRAYHEFTVGKWYHLAGTYDGSEMTLFVNGQSMESMMISGPLIIDESDLYIGKGDPEFSFGEYFHGELDEVRIWNVARTQEEILAAMNAPLTGKEEGLVVYLNFEDGTAKDLSGHDNDGLLEAEAKIVESPYPSSPEAEGGKSSRLVAWWKFENDANDSAGDNHGTVNGNPTYVEGKFGWAISLDGDDYVDCGNPDSLNFGTGDWTISAWIKTTLSGAVVEDRGIVFANGSDEAGGIRYALAVNEAYSGEIALTTDDDAHKAQAIGKTTVNDGAWHHVVGMRKAGQLHVYVDSVLDGGSYLPDEYDLSGTSQHKAYIGVITDNRDSSLYKYFVGLIDELCIIRGAIDANGVSELYSGGDPLIVAKTATIPRLVQAQPTTRQGTETGAHISIEGDWEMIITETGRSFVINFSKTPDGTLAATSMGIPLDKVTFNSGEFHFEGGSPLCIFDGTLKEDGLTIEGKLRQKDQQWQALLKRIEVPQTPSVARGDTVIAAPNGAAPVAMEQLQDQPGGISNIATVLILVLVLIGVVGGIAFFLVKSSIR